MVKPFLDPTARMIITRSALYTLFADGIAGFMTLA